MQDVCVWLASQRRLCCNCYLPLLKINKLTNSFLSPEDSVYDTPRNPEKGFRLNQFKKMRSFFWRESFPAIFHITLWLHTKCIYFNTRKDWYQNCWDYYECEQDMNDFMLGLQWSCVWIRIEVNKYTFLYQDFLWFYKLWT